MQFIRVENSDGAAITTAVLKQRFIIWNIKPFTYKTNSVKKTVIDLQFIVKARKMWLPQFTAACLVRTRSLDEIKRT